ncbi:SDR family NAD(P)-dependent oxidoreductase [Pectinatus sottacetonis]|uniref:SDR family NAD(P)-dependent oxidoreductase n=1 Tax=Pectinatus sottacetonis TaxID=1002795 RepID=UPI0018C7146A|nr:SDR family oxidoreductase [Pectinatus sottacetonis]
MDSVEFNFTGNHYIVTGASSGMGRQVTLELVKAGAVILAVARKKENLLSLKEEAPEQIHIATVDVCDNIALENKIREFVDKYGKLNGSVHAAGISEITPLRAYNKDIAHKIMQTSFWAGIDLIQLVTKSKYSEKGTSNVIFSSVCALSSEKGMFAYTAAKAAINSSIKSIAKEICGKGHRLNSIVPGWVKTPMTERAENLTNTKDLFDRYLLGTGEVKDISGTVLFLLSNRAKWITGSNIVVDGGYLA